MTPSSFARTLAGSGGGVEAGLVGDGVALGVLRTGVAEGVADREVDRPQAATAAPNAARPPPKSARRDSTSDTVRG